MVPGSAPPRCRKGGRAASEATAAWPCRPRGLRQAEGRGTRGRLMALRPGPVRPPQPLPRAAGARPRPPRRRGAPSPRRGPRGAAVPACASRPGLSLPRGPLPPPLPSRRGSSGRVRCCCCCRRRRSAPLRSAEMAERARSAPWPCPAPAPGAGPARLARSLPAGEGQHLPGAALCPAGAVPTAAAPWLRAVRGAALRLVLTYFAFAAEVPLAVSARIENSVAVVLGHSRRSLRSQKNELQPLFFTSLISVTGLSHTVIPPALFPGPSLLPSQRCCSPTMQHYKPCNIFSRSHQVLILYLFSWRLFQHPSFRGFSPAPHGFSLQEMFLLFFAFA